MVLRIQGARLPGCDAVSLSLQSPTFRMIVLPSQVRVILDCLILNPKDLLPPGQRVTPPTTTVDVTETENRRTKYERN